MRVEEYKKKTKQINDSILELKLLDVKAWSKIDPLIAIMRASFYYVEFEKKRRDEFYKNFLKKYQDRSVVIEGIGPEYLQKGIETLNKRNRSIRIYVNTLVFIFQIFIKYLKNKCNNIW